MSFPSTAAAVLLLGSNDGANGLFRGDFCEAIYFQAALNAGQIALLRASQKAYFGTP